MPATYADVPNNTASSWWRDPALRTNVFHCIGCCLCVFYLSLLTGLQALPRWNSYFHSPTGNILGLYAASIFLPSIFTAFIGDYISSRYGRRIAIWVGSAFIIAGALVNGLAKNPGMFIGGRVILGSGGAITKVGAPALLHEIAHPRLRPVLGAVYYGFYYTGSLTSAWLCFAGLYINSEASWRMPCLFQVLGPTLVILITASAPESPRFLIKWNKKEQAREILVKYHANGKEDDELVEWEFQEVCAALQQEADLPKSSYLDFFKTRGNRRRLIAVVTLSVGTNWVGNGIVSYYLTPVLKSVGVTNASQIAGINGGLAAWNLVLALLAGFNVERVGRRPIFFISFIGMFFSYVFVMGLSAGFAKTGHSAIGVAVIPFLFIYYGFYDIAMTPLPYHYSTEILPYNLRSKGLAIFTSVQNIANAFNQFVNSIALAAISWKYYAVYLAVLLCYMVIAYYFYPETKGLALEEIGVLFDYSREEARKMAREAYAHPTLPNPNKLDDESQVGKHEPRHVESS